MYKKLQTKSLKELEKIFETFFEKNDIDSFGYVKSKTGSLRCTRIGKNCESYVFAYLNPKNKLSNACINVSYIQAYKKYQKHALQSFKNGDIIHVNGNVFDNHIENIEIPVKYLERIEKAVETPKYNIPLNGYGKSVIDFFETGGSVLSDGTVISKTGKPLKTRKYHKRSMFTYKRVGELNGDRVPTVLLILCHKYGVKRALNPDITSEIYHKNGDVMDCSYDNVFVLRYENETILTKLKNHFSNWFDKKVKAYSNTCETMIFQMQEQERYISTFLKII